MPLVSVTRFARTMLASLSNDLSAGEVDDIEPTVQLKLLATYFVAVRIGVSFRPLVS